MNQATREQAQHFLRQDERLVAACAFELDPGVPYPPESLLAPPEPPALSRRIEARIPRPLRQFVHARAADAHHPRPAAAGDSAVRRPDAAGSRTPHGAGMEGGWESAAGRFLVSRANAHGSAGGVLAVTDRRWFALADVTPLWRSTPVMREFWEVPRQAVSALRAGPRGTAQTGRMDIEFTDGSWVAVLAVPASAARPFAEASVYHR
ncbi:hypothetical protein C0216_11575 [Streptomyces globosus]|uniref:Uncharacterized protein n=1 Tax=Streptomyces globosus TaxID=68209 RepID=A0A344TZE2_9ACTN|nr:MULTISPECIES: hypothetical protein [Streptomyces]AXE24013.1 hypothetical protein C0216_11575 [Streptomyces globosus]